MRLAKAILALAVYELSTYVVVAAIYLIGRVIVGLTAEAGGARDRTEQQCRTSNIE